MPPRSISLLGPQHRQPNLASVVDEVAGDGPVAVISAGWEEPELDVEELDAHLGRSTVNLALYRRSEALFAQDPQLLDGLWRTRAVLDRYQQSYRTQLTGALDAARVLRQQRPDPRDPADPLVAYQEDAISVVRGIDDRHFERLKKAHAQLESEAGYDRHPALCAEREEVHEQLRACSTLLIAGGHVLVLLNRLRMFEIASQLDGVALVAWSAGAMALAERVVLFHHRPPQGQNNTELAAPGLAVHQGVVPFPHATRRLEIDDPERVSLLSRRFSPDLCLALDPGSRVDRDGAGWRGHGVRRFNDDGSLERLGAPCR